MHPQKLRSLVASRKFDNATAGYCDGYVQANLLAVPEVYAKDFEHFCKENPKPCPLLEKIGSGSYHTTILADGANMLNTLPRYLIWKNGVVCREVSDITDYYSGDLVFFLLGCSFSFEEALIRAGIPLRHVQRKQNVSMFNTNIPLKQVGPFSGTMVVSMRPIHYSQIARACAITAHYPKVHGEPVHIGYPHLIGIKDISQVDYGEPVEIKDDEIPVFWACGVTPQNVLTRIKLPLAITHAPGFMFVGDRRNEEFAECCF